MQLRLAAAAAVLAVLSAGPAVAQDSDGKVRIGVLTDMSSSYAANAGKGSVEAAKIAIDEMGGKINGVPVELVVGDHQNKADIGVSIVSRWFDLEQVDAVADLVNSAVAL